jgi:UrcA family protein
MSSRRESSWKRAVVALAGSVIVLIAFAAQVFGEETGRHRSVYAPQIRSVDASDIDLAQIADAEVLYVRIHSAARAMCRAEAIAWDVKRLLRTRHCIESAVEAAVGLVDAPLLTAVHRGELERIAGR